MTNPSLSYTQETYDKIEVHVGTAHMGVLLLDADNQYYWWPNENVAGAYPHWFLFALANKMKRLNKELLA